MTETTTSPVATGTTDWAPRDGAAPHARRLLSGSGLTMVRISFRRGQILDDHRAPGPIFVQCLSGDIEVDVDTPTGRETHRLTAGSVLHIEAGLMHRLTAADDSVVQVVLHRNVSAPAPS